MLRVDLTQAKAGMALALPVLHPDRAEQVLLREGFELDVATIDRLQQLRIREVWVRYPGLEDVRRFVDPRLVRRRSELTCRVADILTHFHSGLSHAFDWGPFHRTMDALVDAMVANPVAAIFLDDRAVADVPMLRHAARVCQLSVLIGLRLQGYLVQQRRLVEPRHAANLTVLAKGALLHDIGMAFIPEAVVERWRHWRNENDAGWQAHVELGHQRLAGFIERAAAATILQHHQYYDGSGFPRRESWDGVKRGLIGERIPVFARIVTVADQYDELRFQPDGTVWPPVRVLRTLLSVAMSRRLDPTPLKALLRVVPAYSPGSRVRLNTGEWGYVIDWKPDRPCRPSVALVDDPAVIPADDGHVRRLDLAREPGRYIVEVEGQEVADDQFEVPAPLVPEPGRVEVYPVLEAA